MNSHNQRVHNELKAAGVTWFGEKKFAIKYLPKIIRKGEHIKGVIYGRYHEKNGSSFSEGSLTATDSRIIFLDHKPGYTKTDEITYDSVTGIKNITVIFSAVTLHTRVGDVSMKFVNANCASIFVKYIEDRQLKKLES